MGGQCPADGGEQSGAAADGAGRPGAPAGTYCCHWPFTSRTTAGNLAGQAHDSQRPASWLSVMVRAHLAGSMPAWVAQCRTGVVLAAANHVEVEGRPTVTGARAVRNGGSRPDEDCRAPGALVA